MQIPDWEMPFFYKSCNIQNVLPQKCFGGKILESWHVKNWFFTLFIFFWSGRHCCEGKRRHWWSLIRINSNFTQWRTAFVSRTNTRSCDRNNMCAFNYFWPWREDRGWEGGTIRPSLHCFLFHPEQPSSVDCIRFHPKTDQHLISLMRQCAVLGAEISGFSRSFEDIIYTRFEVSKSAANMLQRTNMFCFASLHLQIISTANDRVFQVAETLSL